MQRKTWYSIFGVDAMPLSLKNLLLNDSNWILFQTFPIGKKQKILHYAVIIKKFRSEKQLTVYQKIAGDRGIFPIGKAADFACYL